MCGEGGGGEGGLEDGWATFDSVSVIGFTNANLFVIISRSCKECLHIKEGLPRVNRIIYLKNTSEQGISQLIKGFWEQCEEVKFLKGSREHVIVPFPTLHGRRSSEKSQQENVVRSPLHRLLNEWSISS